MKIFWAGAILIGALTASPGMASDRPNLTCSTTPISPFKHWMVECEGGTFHGHITSIYLAFHEKADDALYPSQWSGFVYPEGMGAYGRFNLPFIEIRIAADRSKRERDPPKELNCVWNDEAISLVQCH